MLLTGSFLADMSSPVRIYVSVGNCASVSLLKILTHLLRVCPAYLVVKVRILKAVNVQMCWEGIQLWLCGSKGRGIRLWNDSEMVHADFTVSAHNRRQNPTPTRGKWAIRSALYYYCFCVGTFVEGSRERERETVCVCVCVYMQANL